MRHQVGVGLRQVAALDQVDDEEQHDEDQAGDDRVAADLVEARRVDRHVGDGGRHAHQHQQQQLEVAPAHGRPWALAGQVERRRLAVQVVALDARRARRAHTPATGVVVSQVEAVQLDARRPRTGRPW